MPSTGPPGGGELLDGVHDWREPRDGAGSQIVTVREASRKDDHVCAAKVCLFVPDEIGVLTEHVLRRVIRVVIAVGSGKTTDGEFHTWSATPAACASQRF